MLKTLKPLLILVFLVGCSPYFQGVGPTTNVPDIVEGHYLASDGVKLALRTWKPENSPKAVILGVHGFNDYGNFLMPGMPAFLQENGILLITYDQRGFGTSPERGIWAGTDAYVSDLVMLIHLLHARYEDIPFFVIGESMGGAVVMTTLSQIKPLPVDGAILSAPAVWGPSTWPWYQKTALYSMSYTLPWLKLSGGGIVQPTDNIETWKNWSRDPLVIKGTRIDALLGVSQLMDKALRAAPMLETPTLLLYGKKDEVIPWGPTAQMVSTLNQKHRVALYPEGWHWLPRDKNGPVVWKDILSWIKNNKVPLPSGFDKDARKQLK